MDLIPREEVVPTRNKRTIFILIGVGIFILILVVVSFLFIFKDRNNNPGGQTEPNGLGAEIQATSSVPTIEAVDPNTKVPVAGEDLGAGVAVPAVVAPASPTGDTKYRSFNISILADKFSPSSDIIVYERDTVDIAFTAKDKDYSFSLLDYGISAPLPKGAVRNIRFQATSSGKYKFTAGSAVGYMIIVPKR